jgi:hypothetical protein
MVSTPRPQRGYIFEANNSWHVRFNVHEDGKRVQRSHKLCDVDADHATKESVQGLCDEFMTSINAANAVNDSQPHHDCPICGNHCPRNLKGQFVKKEIHEHQNKVA